MKQTDLNRAVARATGETVDRIQRMGFGIIVVPVPARPRPTPHRAHIPVLAQARRRSSTTRTAHAA